MATNPYFNQFYNNNEQSLYEDLVVESLKIHAHDMKYMPRTIIHKDQVMTEAVTSRFTAAYDIELYIQNYSSFEGEGELLSKFGLETRDQMTLYMSIRSFNQFVGANTGHEKPQEGDCIYVPMLKSVYQIKYVKDNVLWYVFGKLQMFEVTCDLLEFSNEIFETGIQEIDEINPQYPNIDDTPNYDIEQYDLQAQNTKIEQSGDDILDWTESSPFGES